jgi:hypothetical protein
MSVDIDDAGSVAASIDNMVIPDFFVKRSGFGGHTRLLRGCGPVRKMRVQECNRVVENR